MHMSVTDMHTAAVERGTKMMQERSDCTAPHHVAEIRKESPQTVNLSPES